MSLRDRLQEIEGRIENAARKAGRRRDEITLIAVSKVFPAAALIEAYEAGARHFGENYVQEFEGKYPEVKDLPEARFHLIGHLQSNKSRRAAEMFHSIDTVDSGRLARRLEEHSQPLEVFLEVKLSEEEAKAGVAPAQLGELIESVRACSHLTLRGLMTMPPWSDDAEAARPYFQRLRELAASHGLTGLSMGMSHDFEVAIAEGAT
ncbi:MAG: YggS family pyridoxal phosphate-dependent enzyme, partial [Bryobacteraceae bacterium]|nr:YggS family pyridoxal phosphate-dependent enzyme [Bryobacteraceae bacterium]